MIYSFSNKLFIDIACLFYSLVNYISISNASYPIKGITHETRSKENCAEVLKSIGTLHQMLKLLGVYILNWNLRLGARTQ